MKWWLLLMLLWPQEIKVPRPCIQKVELMPDTECSGTDINHLYCYPLKMTMIKGCEMVVAPKENHGTN